MRTTFAICMTGILSVLAGADAETLRYEPVDSSIAHGDLPWLRTTESDDRVLRMEVAARRFALPEGGPTLTVVGAVHIGERDYYQSLQSHLEPMDLILYEGVSPSGAEPSNPTTTAGKISRTNDRLRLIGILATNLSALSAEVDGALPSYAEDTAERMTISSLDDIRTALASNPRQLAWLDIAQADAWGNPVTFEVQRDDAGAQTGFDVVSLGADGEPGGDGSDADLRFSAQTPLSDSELGRVDGVQVKLARALGLQFQLTEMDESGEQWRNSDMTFAAINERILEQGGGDSLMLLDSIQGSGLPFQLISMVLGIVETLPGLQPRAKMMIMEMLTQTDIESAGSAMGDQAFFDVIIQDRNQVVIDDLLAALSEPGSASWDEIGIIYGAGHLPDLTERLAEQVGFVPIEETWVPAMELDLDRAGISRRERLMVRLQVRQAIKQLDSDNR